jgi:bla regulator protein BlaR1
MEYLLKISVVIFIFYSSYKLFLQRETFFQTNRWYLLSGLIIAALIPFIIIPVYIEHIPTSIESITSIDTNMIVTQESNVLNLWQIISYAYGIGVIFFLGKLGIELASLKFLFNKHEYYKHGALTLVETNDDIPPFSFFNWIVYNPYKYSQEELNHILNHEKVHAKELHSIDIILIQLACVTLWFNPFVWLYKKEVQQNLEFIADKKAQDFSECKKSYQLILLKSSLPQHKFLITNNFYNSQIKKRIIMLHKSKSNKLNAWKYGLILPVLALFLMSFNLEKVFIDVESPSTNLEHLIQAEASAQLNTFYDDINLDDKTKSNQLVQKSIKTIPNTNSKTKATTIKSINISTITSDISVAHITKNTTDSQLDNIKNILQKKGLTVKFKKIKRNTKGEITAIKINARSKTSNTNYNINSNDVIATIKIVYDEENDSISIGNSNAKHIKNTYVYSTKNNKHKIHKSDVGSHTYVLSDDEHENDAEHEHDAKVIINGSAKRIKSSNTQVHIISGDTDNDVLEIIMDNANENHDKKTIIVNGKVESIWLNDDDNHEDVIILKNSDDKNNINISEDENKNPLYIIDGKEVSKEVLVDLKPDTIESVNVLKGKSATETYADKGKNGVILITTKKKN